MLQEFELCRSRKPLKCSLITYKSCATKWLNTGVLVRLINSEQVYFTANVEGKFGELSCGVHLLEGVRLIWSPLNVDFTVIRNQRCFPKRVSGVYVSYCFLILGFV